MVVVDNRSTDGTSEIIDDCAADWPRLRRVIANEQGDKSYALSAAVASSDATFS